ncbi:uncharacterized protein LOC143596629 [Bidens hawaiensis]|uniref:uncharacterized protein LOC143596629 n=1 Tax=Bidens hawaiensis TaxID=980011 RepID=UPI004049C4C4
MAGDQDKPTSKTKEEGIDHDSPYYLHPSDYPRQMHVNDVLTDGNYADWSQEMQNFLFAKNKIGFVNGSIKKPEEDSSKYMPWIRCDAMIKGWLHTAMEKEIRTIIKYAMTTRKIWADLKERFGTVSAPRAYELKQSLNIPSKREPQYRPTTRNFVEYGMRSSPSYPSQGVTVMVANVK